MFGKKQKQIESLTASVEFWRKREVERGNSINDLSEKLLTSVNKNRDAEARIDMLEYALSESKGLNQALEDENRDLVRQLELYRTLLASVRVNVALPARKK